MEQKELDAGLVTEISQLKNEIARLQANGQESEREVLVIKEQRYVVRALNMHVCMYVSVSV
jgi:hypothetical protein